MITKWKTKPISVEVIQLDDTRESIIKAFEFVYGVRLETFQEPFIKAVIDAGGMVILITKGDKKASFGDYIVKDTNSDVYTYQPDVFRTIYERELIWDENL